MYASIALGIDTYQSAHGEQWILDGTMIRFQRGSERAGERKRERERVQRTLLPSICNRLNLFLSKVYIVHQK